MNNDCRQAAARRLRKYLVHVLYALRWCGLTSDVKYYQGRLVALRASRQRRVNG